MSRSPLHKKDRFGRLEASEKFWDRCNICGQRFSNWPELHEHKRNHTEEEIERSLKFGRDRTDESGT